MGFLAPLNLLALLGLGLAALLYWRWSAGRASAFAWHPDAGRMAALARRPLWAYAPALGFLAALALALLATARPTLQINTPDNLAGVVMAIENGWSMRQTDIAPSRIQATQLAANALLEQIPPSVKVGIATFSSYATLLLPLTNDRADFREAITGLDLGGGYSFTYGLLAALEALPDAAEGGSPGAIVLFSHGHDVSGNDPLEIAGRAAARGIKIHSIGVGTHGHNFDDEMLKKVADLTGGRYYPIFSAADLSNAHHDLGKVLAWRPQTTEVTGAFTLLAACLLGLSMGISSFRRRVI